MIAAPRRSCGKTMIAVGLAAALRRRGVSVQTFKKGPDYIDPSWLALASGRPCRNLDPYLSPQREIDACFARHADAAQAVLVEANMGLHDAMAEDGADSSATLAARLDLRVILVVDARGMTRSVAPLVLGMQRFDPDVAFAGVVLNHCTGARHEARLRAAIARHTTLPVIGAIGHHDGLGVDERHLGLVPGNEQHEAARVVDRLADVVERGIDVAALAAPACAVRPGAVRLAEVRLAEVRAASQTESQAGFRTALQPVVQPRCRTREPLRIGIARDRAFGFYYADDLDAFAVAGAQLVPFDTLADPALPPVDALFIGGGFPERHLDALAANRSLREALRERLADGMPAYAECGGLMYLCRAIEAGGRRHEMVGAIPADATMLPRPVGRGYVHLAPAADTSGWWCAVAGDRGCGPAGGPAGNDTAAPVVRAHEFHHSTLVDVAPGLRYGWRVRRGHGIDGARDGIVVGNLFASYAHLRSGTGAGTCWPAAFVAFARQRTDPHQTGAGHGHVAALHG
ncbi:MAG: cobyrinate a,c-diamide synthase [Lautropia sp.]